MSVLLAPLAMAADQDGPTIFATLKPQVGAWAEYSFEGKNGDKVKTKGVYRMSVVGKKGDLVWVEQKMTREIPEPKKDEPAAIIKMGIAKDKLEKAFIKTPQGVMDMSSMMRSGFNKTDETVKKTKMVKVGDETIQVPAGKYKATHYKIGEDGKSGDTWVREGTGPYGLVKQLYMHGDHTTTILLLATGDGAKSEVDESTAKEGGFGAMMAEQRRQAKKDGKKGAAKADANADEDQGDLPSLGGLFKSALKKKAGLGN